MLKTLQAFFDARIGNAAENDHSEPSLRIATAALFVEMTRSDFEVHHIETTAVIESLRQLLGLDPSTADELLDLARAEADEAIELFQFTRLIDRAFEPAQKCELVERLWRVAMADDHIDEREEYLVRKVAELLHVPHRDFIAAKKRARAARAAD